MINVFQQLRAITHFTTEQNQSGFITKGSGNVVTRKLSDTIIIFNESGQRQIDDGKNIEFTNTYRWNALTNNNLSLSHLRLGLEKPVHLIEFEQYNQTDWHTKSPHICGNDIYRATITQHKHKIQLQWNIQGPKKSITINVVYCI